MKKKNNELLKAKEDFDKIIKNYKFQIDEKNEEIIQLKEKNILLNKKLKNFEEKKSIKNNNSIDNISGSISFIQNNKELSEYKKSNNKRIFIKNIKRNHFANSSLNNSINHKNFFNKNMSLSMINYNHIDYNTNIKKSSNKNNSLNEIVSLYLNKIDENLNNNNMRNVASRNSKAGKIYKNEKFKSAINITNNNYNFQKNNVLINLNNINVEKLKIQKKLAEYRKMIDRKIYNLKSKNSRKVNWNKKKKTSLKNERNFDKLNSLRITQNNKNLEKSCFIKSINLEKINSSYRLTKRDSSYNFERNQKK